MYILCIAISFLYHSHSEWYLTKKTAPFFRTARLFCVWVCDQVNTVQVFVMVMMPTMIALMMPAMYGFFVAL